MLLLRIAWHLLSSLVYQVLGCCLGGEGHKSKALNNSKQNKPNNCKDCKSDFPHNVGHIALNHKA